MIQLFYDGLGVTNPLRGNSILHNVGVFLYTIKNFPHRNNSCFANVHLLALRFAQDLKKYGFDPIIEKFVGEINKLSRAGFEGNFPLLGNRTVYAGLCQVTCDNLALIHYCSQDKSTKNEKSTMVQSIIETFPVFKDPDTGVCK